MSQQDNNPQAIETLENLPADQQEVNSATANSDQASAIIHPLTEGIKAKVKRRRRRLPAW